MTTLEDAAALARDERGLVIVATLRGDGTIQSSLVNAGIVPHPVGFQNSATGPDLGFYAARSYSLMRPPRTGRRWIRFRERSATG